MPYSDLNSLKDNEIQKSHALFVATHGEDGARWVFEGDSWGQKDFEGLMLAQSRWQGGISNANFVGTSFQDAEFNEAVLKYCTFTGCTFKNCRFIGGWLSNVDFNNCGFQDTLFKGNFTGKEVNMNGCYLKNTRMRGKMSFNLVDCIF